MDSAPGWRQRTAAKCSRVVVQRAAGSSPSATSRVTADSVPDNRLRKSEILRGFGSFRFVLSHEQSVRAHGIRCHYALSQKIPPGHVQVGFAVKRPTGSVERNRFKRQLREAYRTSNHALTALCDELQLGLACVLLLRAERYRTPAEYANIRTDVILCLEKLCATLSHS
jgi:ribonuclease P protein component